MTRQQALEDGKTRLETAGIEESLLGVRLLLQHVLGCERIELVLNPQLELSEKEWQVFDLYISRRCLHEPIQHIMETQNFLGYDFKVSRATLIPRPETEELVNLAASLLRLNEECQVLDMGTGSGCIPVSLCLLNDKVQCIGVDYSLEALEVARQNGHKLGVADRIRWIHSNLFEQIEKSESNRCDMLISNPPYINSDEVLRLDREVKDYEPVSALDGGVDGLCFYRAITEQAGDYLKTGGYLLYEIGHDQKAAVMEMMALAGYQDVKGLQDLSGRDRIVYGRKPYYM